MLRELTAAAAPHLPAPRPAQAPPPGQPSPMLRDGPVESAAPDLREPVRPVEEAIHLAASALFRDRPVEVQGFRDEASGRFVYRVADRRSGEVLLQSPPDALLRFFASVREALGPLVEIEA